MSKSAETPRRKYLQQLKPSALRKIAESCTHISSEDVEAAEDSHCPKESMIRLLLRSEDGAPSLEWQSDAPEPEIAAVQPAAASQPPNPFRARGVKSGSTLVIEAFAAAKAELQKCLTDEQTTVVQVNVHLRHTSHQSKIKTKRSTFEESCGDATTGLQLGKGPETFRTRCSKNLYGYSCPRDSRTRIAHALG
eukprot:SAG31_NODE_18_length_35375_cov_22.525315_3_plen_193_part_00